MDTLVGLKYDIKKLFLVFFIPGTLAMWPWVFLIGKWFNANHFSGHKIITDYASTTYIVSLLFFYGSGHIVAKLGSRFEVWLEYFIYRFAKLHHWLKFMCNKEFRKEKQKSMKENKKYFQKVWYNYLSLHYEREKAPLFVRYYSELVIGLKFELNTVAALLIMIPSLLYLEINGFTKIMTESNLNSLIISCAGLAFYLLYEAVKGVKTNHELREEMCKSLSNPK